MDEEEKWVDINIDGEDNRAIEYDYNSLEDSISDNDGSAERLFDETIERVWFCKRWLN